MSSSRNEQERISLSAEEIAAVLADTYFDVNLIGEDKDEEIRTDSEDDIRSARRRQRMKEMRRRKKQ